MISLKVHFSEGDTDSVNHAMLYVCDSENKTMQRIQCLPGPKDEYYVHKIAEFYDYPRNNVGEGISIRLAPLKKEVTGTQLADILVEIPPPDIGAGDCQWWILTCLSLMEEIGFVKPGSTFALLADKRMNSKNLMEFSERRDEIRADFNDIEEDELSGFLDDLSTAMVDDLYSRDYLVWLGVTFVDHPFNKPPNFIENGDMNPRETGEIFAELDISSV